MFICSLSYGQVIKWIDTTGGKVVERQAGTRYPLPVINSLIKNINNQPDTIGIFRCTLDSITITGTHWYEFDALAGDSTIFITNMRIITPEKMFTVPAKVSYSCGRFDISFGNKIYIWKQNRYNLNVRSN
jgi:hypothetical protein